MSVSNFSFVECDLRASGAAQAATRAWPPSRVQKPSQRMGLLAHLKTWLSCGLWVAVWGTSNAWAQARPWHLGLSTPAVTAKARLADLAPAAINTADIAPGSHRIVVAVIDSGVMAEHPSLAGRLLPGYDMQSAPGNLRGDRSANFAPDDLGARCAERAASQGYRTHGTEVASLIAGNGVNGVWGVNPRAQIVPIRVVGACGMTRRDLMDAVRWAAGLPVAGVPDNPNPARVINLSLAGGGATCSAGLQALVNQLTAQGVFIVAAAGNNFHKPLFEPANCKGVMSVGALDAENRIEVYSAMDARTQLYAPGGGKGLDGSQSWAINKLRVATYDLDFFGRERANVLDRGVGTSYAAPLVAGFISLWLSYQPEKSSAAVMAELPQYLRAVEPHLKCPDCLLQGIAANNQLRNP